MGGQVLRRQGIKWRTLVSLATAWMFLILGITGLVLYVVPHGRIAYWVDWRFLGLSKTDWGNIHVVTSVLFLVVGGWHLYFNWRLFLNHLRRKIAEGARVRRELLITSVVAVLIVASAFWRVPPLGYLLDLNDAIKDSWVESEDFEPPFGHAELLSLERFCKKTRIDKGKAWAELERRGFKMESESQSLGEIAQTNGVSPKDVFAAISKFQQRQGPAPAPGASLTNDDVLERFEGSGLGKKTVAAACELGGGQVARCLERLESRSVRAEPEETVRDVAMRAGMKPIQVMQQMLVDQKR